jgi:flagellar biosynthesis chaperone FliJ
MEQAEPIVKGTTHDKALLNASTAIIELKQIESMLKMNNRHNNEIRYRINKINDSMTYKNYGNAEAEITQLIEMMKRYDETGKTED